jgi:predicted site-specific integrase-resolvase
MNDEHYISPSRIQKQFDITSGTLRRWAEEGKIKCIRPNTGGVRGGRRIYNVNDVQQLLGIHNLTSTPKNTICYARVSSSHQQEDLQRQIQLLQETYPTSKIIKDIGSGLNWHRSGFNSLLEQIHSGTVDTLVVTYKDRLCRFGFELFDWILKKAHVKLVVLGSTNDTTDVSKELAEDLLSITTVFVAKNNGLRSSAFRKQRREKEITSSKSIQNASLSNN